MLSAMITTPVFAADGLISIKLDKTAVKIGETLTATVTVENITAEMLVVPLHFNPDVLRVADKSGAIVNSEIKTSAQIRSGDHGIIPGQMLSNETDPAGDPLYWNGAVFENPNYPRLDNGKGLYRLFFRNVSAKEIKKETLMVVNFVVIGSGETDIRFAKESDPAYDSQSPTGASYVGSDGTLVNINANTQSLKASSTTDFVTPPKQSTGGNGGGGFTTSVAPPAENTTLTYEVPEKLYENSLARAADETGNRMIINIEADDSVTEYIIKIPVSAIEKALDALVLETEFETPIGKISFDNDLVMYNANASSKFVICSLTKDKSNVTIDGKEIEARKPKKKFDDLDENHWAYSYIMPLVEVGYLNGMSETEFCPDDNVTREQFAKMLISARGIYYPNQSCDFSDLDENHWAYSYIAAAVQAGIITGYEDGSFGIGKNISRQEMAVMAARINKEFSVKNPQATFVDQNEIGSWAADSVKKMQMAGIISGMPDGKFAPNLSATRAQAAKIIFEIMML